MDITELERLMIKHSVAIRALPKTSTTIVEKRHMDQYPNAEVKYLPDFKREMLVKIRENPHGGQFVVEQIKNMCSTVRFQGTIFFNSLDEVCQYLQDLDKS